jgi:hypothetical protein
MSPEVLTSLSWLRKDRSPADSYWPSLFFDSSPYARVAKLCREGKLSTPVMVKD